VGEVVRGVAEGRTSIDETAVVIGAFRSLLVDPAAGLPTTGHAWSWGLGRVRADLPGRIESWVFPHHIAP
jgi:hypothetical protein